MLAEVENGNIGTIIIRLGRNYVQMGMLREQLRRANARLIAAQLSDEHIRVPACHQAQLGVRLWQNREIKNP